MTAKQGPGSTELALERLQSMTKVNRVLGRGLLFEILFLLRGLKEPTDGMSSTEIRELIEGGPIGRQLTRARNLMFCSYQALRALTHSGLLSNSQGGQGSEFHGTYNITSLGRVSLGVMETKIRSTRAKALVAVEFINSDGDPYDLEDRPDHYNSALRNEILAFNS